MPDEALATTTAEGLEGAFEQGSLLWFWYDTFLVVPAFLVAAFLTYRALVALPWDQRAPQVAKGLAVLGSVLVLLVALDRIGLVAMTVNADAIGFASLLGGVATVVAGGYAFVVERGGIRFWSKAKDAEEALPDEPLEDIGITGATRILTRVPTSTAWLVMRTGGDPGRIIELSTDRATIGRDPESTIVIDHPSVSATHALIRIDQGQYLLYDLVSQNGTSVNDLPVTGVVLKNGSRISVGNSELFYTQIGEGGKDGGENSRGVVLVRSGPSVGQSFQVGDRDLVVGRQPGEGGARIDDPSVSQVHALLRPTPFGCQLFDLGSANGTAVDDVPVVGAVLKNGDILRFGESELQFVQQDT